MDSLNFGLVKSSAASSIGLVLGGAGHQRGRGRGKLAVEHHQSLAGLVAGHAQQIRFGRVQVLRVARVGDPDRLALAQHAGEPVDLAAAGSCRRSASSVSVKMNFFCQRL